MKLNGIPWMVKQLFNCRRYCRSAQFITTQRSNPFSPSSTRSFQVNHQSRWDPSLPGDFTYLDTDYTVVSTTNSLNPQWISPPPVAIIVLWEEGKHTTEWLKESPNQHSARSTTGGHSRWNMTGNGTPLLHETKNQHKTSTRSMFVGVRQTSVESIWYPLL